MNYMENFRVNSEGFDNRFRRRQNFAPHCDLAYAVIYPGNENSDYTSDVNKNSMRLNKYADKYEMACKQNGVFHTEVPQETLEQ